MSARVKAQLANLNDFQEPEKASEELYFEDYALEFFNNEEAVVDEDKGKILQFKRKLDQHNQKIIHFYNQKFDCNSGKKIRMAQLLSCHILRQYGFKDIEDEIYNIASTFIEEEIEKGLDSTQHQITAWFEGVHWKFHIISIHENTPFYLHRNRSFEDNEAIILLKHNENKRGNHFVGFLPATIINSLYEEVSGITERIEISDDLFLKIPPDDWPLA